MMLEDMVRRVQDTINVRRVFGEPYTHDGVMVIPVATVTAGAGGGSGSDSKQGSSGEGGGFGGVGRPIGAYVIHDGRASWQPAVDVNRTIVWAHIALIALFVSVSQIQRGRTVRR